MGFGAPIHWIVLLLIIFLVFGTGRISGLMGDVAKGIKQFKKGMADEDEPAATPAASRPAPRLQQQPPIEPSPERAPQPMQDDRPQA